MKICDIDIHGELLRHLKSKFPDKKINNEVINYLFAAGLVEKKQILRMLIKSKYYDLLKAGNTTRSSILDCAIEFDVCESFVENTIYKWHR